MSVNVTPTPSMRPSMRPLTLTEMGLSPPQATPFQRQW